MESETNKSKREEVNSYLRTVAIEALQAALVVLVLEKPVDPIGFLSDYFAGLLPDELARAPTKDELPTDLFELQEVKVYLDCTVAGAMHQALRELVRQRPPKPSSFLASYFNQRRLLPRADPLRPSPALATAASASSRPASGAVGSRARRRFEEQRAHLACLQEQRRADAHARGHASPQGGGRQGPDASSQQQDTSAREEPGGARERRMMGGEQGGPSGAAPARLGGRSSGRKQRFELGEEGGEMPRGQGEEYDGGEDAPNGGASHPRRPESAADRAVLQDVTQQLAKCLAATQAATEPVRWALQSLEGGASGEAELNRGQVTAISGAVVGAVEAGAHNLACAREACERAMQREQGGDLDGRSDEGGDGGQHPAILDATRLRILMELGKFCESVKKLLADALASVEAPLSAHVMAGASSGGKGSDANNGDDDPALDEVSALAADVRDVRAMLPLLAARVELEAATAQASAAHALWPGATDPLVGCWPEVQLALDGLWESLLTWKKDALAASKDAPGEPAQTAELANSLFLRCNGLEVQLGTATTRFGALIEAAGCMGEGDALPLSAREQLVLLYRGFFLAVYVELADLAVETTAGGTGGRSMGDGARIGEEGQPASGTKRDGTDASSSIPAHVADMRCHIEVEVIAAVSRLAERSARGGAAVEPALREPLAVIWRTLAELRQLAVTLRAVAGATAAPTEGEVAAFQTAYASSNPDATRDVEDGAAADRLDDTANGLHKLDPEALLAGKSRQELKAIHALLALRAAMDATRTTYRSCLGQITSVFALAGLPGARDPDTQANDVKERAVPIPGRSPPERTLASLCDRVEAALIGVAQGLVDVPVKHQHGVGRGSVGLMSGLMASEVEGFVGKLLDELGGMQQAIVTPE